MSEATLRAQMEPAGANVEIGRDTEVLTASDEAPQFWRADDAQHGFWLPTHEPSTRAHLLLGQVRQEFDVVVAADR